MGVSPPISLSLCFPRVEHWPIGPALKGKHRGQQRAQPTGPSAATVGGVIIVGAKRRFAPTFQPSNEVCEQPGKAVLRDTEVVKWDCVGWAFQPIE